MTLKLLSKWIIPIIWGMLFCTNMFSWLHTQSQLSLFLSGIMLGGTFISLLYIPFLGWYDEYTKRILEEWKDSIKFQGKLIERLKELECKKKK